MPIKMTWKQKVFWTGMLGAFAPQILRWYSQGGLDVGEGFDPWRIVGRLFVTAFFLGLAGCMVLLWEVRTLKEAFWVGLAVPSIILSAGSDINSVITSPADAQEVGIVSVVAKTEEGEAIPYIKVRAVDEVGHTFSVAGQNLALPAGTYTVQVEASGYKPAILPLTVESGKTLKEEVILSAKPAFERFFEGIRRPFEQLQRK